MPAVRRERAGRPPCRQVEPTRRAGGTHLVHGHVVPGAPPAQAGPPGQGRCGGVCGRPCAAGHGAASEQPLAGAGASTTRPQRRPQRSTAATTGRLSAGPSPADRLPAVRPRRSHACFVAEGWKCCVVDSGGAHQLRQCTPGCIQQAVRRRGAGGGVAEDSGLQAPTHRSTGDASHWSSGLPIPGSRCSTWKRRGRSRGGG